jgi:hypothetical protein
MKIAVLYFEGCPSWQTGVENLNAALKLEGLSWPVELVGVQDDEDAQRRRFLGSPSFQFNGDDLWSQNRQEYAMSCRMYPTHEGLRGWPTVEMFRERLRGLAGRKP